MNTILRRFVSRVVSRVSVAAAMAIALLVGHILFVGQAYVAITANELLKLTASDGKKFDLFGFSAAISGDTPIGGAPVHPWAMVRHRCVTILTYAISFQIKPLVSQR